MLLQSHSVGWMSWVVIAGATDDDEVYSDEASHGASGEELQEPPLQYRGWLY